MSFNILVEDRVKLFGVEIEVTDINDNAPKFQAENLDVKINENVAPGIVFLSRKLLIRCGRELPTELPAQLQ